MFAKGSRVVQVQPAPIVGVVSGFSVDQETGDVQVLVSWPAEDGSVHSRHFKESELTAEPVEPVVS